MFFIKPIAEKIGFKFWKPIVWDKVTIGMGYHYRARYEFILFFEKGKRRLSNLGTPDVLEFKRVYRGYPTEKPVPLLEVLISQSSEVAETVLDPFLAQAQLSSRLKILNENFKGVTYLIVHMNITKNVKNRMWLHKNKLKNKLQVTRTPIPNLRKFDLQLVS